MINAQNLTSNVAQAWRNNPWAYSFLLLWILAMIALPIARWTFGDEALPIGINVAAILQASAVLLMVASAWGWRDALRALLIVAFIGWSSEFIGHSTGIPFGAYDYTDILQPQLAGVPLLIPIAWFMLLPSSWVMAQHIVGERKTWRDRAFFVVVSALALTAWDLFLDPQMVEWGFWEWEQTAGGYFGVPWSNYAGWLLTGVVVTLLVRPYRYELPIVPLLTVYGVVWFLQSIGLAVFWGQPGPALVGFLAMGALLLWAGLSYRRERTR